MRRKDKGIRDEAEIDDIKVLFLQSAKAGRKINVIKRNQKARFEIDVGVVVAHIRKRKKKHLTALWRKLSVPAGRNRRCRSDRNTDK